MPAPSERQPRLDLHEALRADLAATRHPSDGGGRAWLEGGENPVTAGTSGRWTLIFEVGEHGIAEGGRIFFQVSPFWGWSTPQIDDPARPGFTEVTTVGGKSEPGLDLDIRTLDQQLLGLEVRGRALLPGERLRLDYGAGPAGAVADRFAERDSRFFFAVDGDGDGVRELIDDAPAVEVVAGPPQQLLLTLPSTARPGERVRLTAAVVDRRGNAGHPYTGEIVLDGLPPGTGVEPRLVLEAADHGRKSVELEVREPGLVRVAGRTASVLGARVLEAKSNPLQVTSQGQRVYWGDLQNHSNVSDGTAVPEDFFLYARDVAALDVVALTDHDHWGMRFLDRHPETWDAIRELNQRFHQPGRFVTVLGYEWTNWIYGHRHVLFFDESDANQVFSSLDPAYETPQQLWDALRGRRALTIAHHSAGGPVSVDWSIPPDPELEPVTEVVSVHGSSEAADSPGRIYGAVAGNYVRDALARGYRFGFLGSSDGHDGHPGLGHLAAPTGGLAAILADELTRDGVYRALRARRVYATSGPRILIRLTFGGYRMGADVPADETARAALEGAEDPVPGLPPSTLAGQIYAPSAIRHVDLVRSGRTLDRLSCEGRLECSFAADFTDLEAGEHLYIRVVQEDGGSAWSSPFYFE